MKNRINTYLLASFARLVTSDSLSRSREREKKMKQKSISLLKCSNTKAKALGRVNIALRHNPGKAQKILTKILKQPLAKSVSFTEYFPSEQNLETT